MCNLSGNVNMQKYNCIVVLGPTAVGKTAIGVQLAHNFGGEIISADSRQTYKGLEALHSVDVLTFIRQVIILRFIQKCAVSDISVSHKLVLFDG